MMREWRSPWVTTPTLFLGTCIAFGVGYVTSNFLKNCLQSISTDDISTLLSLYPNQKDFDQSKGYCVSLSEIKLALQRISAHIHRTPLLTSMELNKRAGSGVRLFFKCELFQKTGSFKIRGATNACFSLSDAEASKGLLTHSSGNHAQAVALAAKNRGIPAYIVMPENAPAPKRAAVEHTYNAKVFICESTNAERAAMAEEKQQEYGAAFIHPSNNPTVIAGQGTIALEMLAQISEMLNNGEKLDAIIIPIGGGGMISGMAVAAKSLQPGIRIFGAEPIGADDSYTLKNAKNSDEQFETYGKCSRHSHGKPFTCADGLKTVLKENNWPIVRDLVDEIFRVSEEEILSASELIYSRMKLAIEPSAGTGVAVALSKNFQSLGLKRVGVVLCGGNIEISPLFTPLREKFVG